MTLHTVPEIGTNRLLLRGPMLADLDALAEFMASDRATFVGGPIGREDSWRMLTRIAGHWGLRGYGLWFVEDRASGRLAGWAGILHQIEWPEPELAWSLFPGFEGRGVAFEAAQAARDHAAQAFGIKAPISHIHADNHRSRRLAERLGARFERDGDIHGEAVQIWRHPPEPRA